MTPEKASLADWPKHIDIKQIHAQFGSPAWIVSEQQLKSNLDELKRFTGDAGRIFYPVKTNPSLTVLQLLAKLGAGADCASQLEINLALLAGIEWQHISYNTPVQDIRLCEFVLMMGGCVVMDDINAIMELQSRIENNNYKGQLFLRINLPEYIGYANENDNQELMAHGHKSSKFGIPSEDLNHVLKGISLPIVGLHVHVGTQMDNLKSFEHAIVSLNNLTEVFRANGHTISEINLGGGLGIPFDSNQHFPSLKSWCNTMSKLKKEEFNYYVEPGHALVGNAVALLTSVQTVKESRGKKWAIVDVGTDQLTKVTLLKWPHRIIGPNKSELEPGNDAIAGPLCFAGDTLKENINVDGLMKNCPLLITEAGAYTFSLANKFNGRLAPKWLLLNAQGDLVQTMDRESVYDELHHSKYEWNLQEKKGNTQAIDLKEVEALSSKYLFSSCESDRFEYEEVICKIKNHYTFTVSISSVVDFVSMPFATRIIGDAAIVSVLHNLGFKHKTFPIWGRKLTMDCADKIKNNGKFDFTIALSELLNKGAQKCIVVRFKTLCNNFSGSLIVSFEA